MSKTGIIGKKMIVRANVAGVHAGIVEAFDGATATAPATATAGTR